MQAEWKASRSGRQSPRISIKLHVTFPMNTKIRRSPGNFKAIPNAGGL